MAEAVGRCCFVECGKVADPEGMCPRHALLVKELGMEKAVLVEVWWLCLGCRQRFFGERTECRDCWLEPVCATCSKSGACCRKAADWADEEAADLKEEANRARRRADNLRHGSRIGVAQ